MIEYNDENCVKVARYVAEQMDIERLIEFATEKMYDRYADEKTGEYAFRLDIDINSIKEKDLDGIPD